MPRVTVCGLIVLTDTTIAESCPCRSAGWQPTSVHDLLTDVQIVHSTSASAGYGVAR